MEEAENAISHSIVAKNCSVAALEAAAQAKSKGIIAVLAAKKASALAAAAARSAQNFADKVDPSDEQQKSRANEAAAAAHEAAAHAKIAVDNLGREAEGGGPLSVLTRENGDIEWVDHIQKVAFTVCVSEANETTDAAVDSAIIQAAVEALRLQQQSEESELASKEATAGRAKERVSSETTANWIEDSIRIASRRIKVADLLASDLAERIGETVVKMLEAAYAEREAAAIDTIHEEEAFDMVLAAAMSASDSTAALRGIDHMRLLQDEAQKLVLAAILSASETNAEKRDELRERIIQDEALSIVLAASRLANESVAAGKIASENQADNIIEQARKLVMSALLAASANAVEDKREIWSRVAGAESMAVVDAAAELAMRAVEDERNSATVIQGMDRATKIVSAALIAASESTIANLSDAWAIIAKDEALKVVVAAAALASEAASARGGDVDKLQILQSEAQRLVVSAMQCAAEGDETRRKEMWLRITADEGLHLALAAAEIATNAAAETAARSEGAQRDHLRIQDRAKTLVMAALAAADEADVDMRREIWRRVADDEALGLVRAAANRASESTAAVSVELHKRAKRLVVAALLTATEVSAESLGGDSGEIEAKAVLILNAVTTESEDVGAAAPARHAESLARFAEQEADGVFSLAAISALNAALKNAEQALSRNKELDLESAGEVASKFIAKILEMANGNAAAEFKVGLANIFSATKAAAVCLDGVSSAVKSLAETLGTNEISPEKISSKQKARDMFVSQLEGALRAAVLAIDSVNNLSETANRSDISQIETATGIAAGALRILADSVGNFVRTDTELTEKEKELLRVIAEKVANAAECVETAREGVSHLGQTLGELAADTMAIASAEISPIIVSRIIVSANEAAARFVCLREAEESVEKEKEKEKVEKEKAEKDKAEKEKQEKIAAEKLAASIVRVAEEKEKERVEEERRRAEEAEMSEQRRAVAESERLERIEMKGRALEEVSADAASTAVDGAQSDVVAEKSLVGAKAATAEEVAGAAVERIVKNGDARAVKHFEIVDGEAQRVADTRVKLAVETLSQRIENVERASQEREAVERMADVVARSAAELGAGDALSEFLNEQVYELTAQLGGAAAEISESKRRQEELRRDLAERKIEEEEMGEQVARAAESILKLESLAEAQHQSDALKLKEAEERISKFEKTVMELEKNLKETAKARREAEDRIKSLSDELEKVRSSLLLNSNLSAGAASTRIIELQSALEKARAEITDLSETANRAKATTDRLQMEIDDVSKLRDLATKFGDERAEKLSQRITEISSELGSMQSQYDTANRRLNEAQEDIAKLKEKLTAAEKAAGEAEKKMAKSAAEFENEKKLLQAQLEREKLAKAEIEAEQIKLKAKFDAELTTERQKAQSTNVQTDRRSDGETRAGTAEWESERKALIAQLEKEKLAKAEIEAEKIKLKAKFDAELATERQKAQSTNSTDDEKTRRLAANLEALEEKRREEAQMFQEKLKILADARSAAESREAQLSRQVEQLLAANGRGDVATDALSKQLETQIEQLRRQVTGLQTDLAAADARTRDLRVEADAVRTQMQIELERERARSSGSERELAAANARNDEARRTISRFEERLTQAEQQARATQDRYVMAAAQLAAAEEAATRQQQTDEAKTRATELLARREAEARAQNAIEVLTEKLRRSMADNDELRRAVETARNENGVEAQARIQELEERLSASEEEVQVAEAQFRATTAELEASLAEARAAAAEAIVAVAETQLKQMDEAPGTVTHLYRKITELEMHVREAENERVRNAITQLRAADVETTALATLESAAKSQAEMVRQLLLAGQEHSDTNSVRRRLTDLESTLRATRNRLLTSPGRQRAQIGTTGDSPRRSILRSTPSAQRVLQRDFATASTAVASKGKGGHRTPSPGARSAMATPLRRTSPERSPSPFRSASSRGFPQKAVGSFDSNVSRVAPGFGRSFSPQRQAAATSPRVQRGASPTPHSPRPLPNVQYGPPPSSRGPVAGSSRRHSKSPSRHHSKTPTRRDQTPTQERSRTPTWSDRTPSQPNSLIRSPQRSANTTPTRQRSRTPKREVSSPSGREGSRSRFNTPQKSSRSETPRSQTPTRSSARYQGSPSRERPRTPTWSDRTPSDQVTNRTPPRHSPSRSRSRTPTHRLNAPNSKSIPKRSHSPATNARGPLGSYLKSHSPSPTPSPHASVIQQRHVLNSPRTPPHTPFTPPAQQQQQQQQAHPLWGSPQPSHRSVPSSRYPSGGSPARSPYASMVQLQQQGSHSPARGGSPIRPGTPPRIGTSTPPHHIASWQSQSSLSQLNRLPSPPSQQQLRPGSPARGGVTAISVPLPNAQNGSPLRGRAFPHSPPRMSTTDAVEMQRQRSLFQQMQQQRSRSPPRGNR